MRRLYAHLLHIFFCPSELPCPLQSGCLHQDPDSLSLRPICKGQPYIRRIQYRTVNQDVNPALIADRLVYRSIDILAHKPLHIYRKRHAVRIHDRTLCPFFRVKI